METLLKRFIGKECLLYTKNAQFSGVIKVVEEGAVLLENKEEYEIINLLHVVRVREYPRGKNGQKKSMVWD